MEITATQVMQLRDITGAGMMDCKKALVEALGDFKKAEEIIKKKGLKIAAAKSDRESNEGQIFIAKDKNSVAYVLVTSETDFVSKNEKFQNFGQGLANKLLAEGKDKWLAEQADNGPIRDLLLRAIQELGENIKIAKGEIIKAKDLGVYLHNNKKVLAIVEANSEKETKDGSSLLYDIAMHVAANRVEAIDESKIPQKILDAEREMFLEQAKNKPADMKEKIIAGQLKKFKAEIVLNEQKFLKNPEFTVADWIKQRSKELGYSINLINFHKISA